MWGGGTSQAMSHHTDSLLWRTRADLCVCLYDSLVYQSVPWNSRSESLQSNHRTDVCRHEVGVQLRGLWDHKANGLHGSDVCARAVIQVCHSQNYSVTITIFHSATQVMKRKFADRKPD